MDIRFARKEDRDSVLQLLDGIINEVNQKSGKPAKFTEGDEARDKMFEEMLRQENAKIFVAEEYGELVGVADLFISPIMRRGYYQGHLEDLVVAEHLRGRGIGSALLNAVKKYCQESKVKVLKLTSGLELVDAHRFYEKNGGIYTEKLFRFDF